jgi:hypothetical protein
LEFLGWPLLAVGIAALVVIAPFFWAGNPSGHDFEFHLNSWMEVLSQWKHGMVFPQWAGGAQYGYGEPRFVFYPPLSWMLGAALGAMLPWPAVPGAFIWIALVLAGSTMFRLARAYLPRRDAVCAAVLYAANPYFLINIYWRSAMAELLAAALFPMLVYYLLRLEQDRARGIPPLALILAAAWLTNVPAAVMICYSLALFIVVLAWLHKSHWLPLHGSAAVALGCALAGVYLVPVAHQQTWINLQQALSFGVRPQDNFVFTMLANVDHNRFNFFISAVVLAQVLVLAAAAWQARGSGQHLLWWSLTVWGLAAGLLMLPFTQLAWTYLPKLQFIQLPWRLLVCLNASLAMLLVLGWKKNAQRTVVYLAMILFVAWAGLHIQPPWWDQAEDIAEMADNQATGAGYEGVDEYVPAGGDANAMKQDAPLVAFEGGGAAQVEVTRWSTEDKEFTVKASEPGHLILRLADYRGWRVEVNGRVVETSMQLPAGQMRVPITAGENRVRVHWQRNWDTGVGWGISLLGGMVWLGMVCDGRGKIA